MVENPAKYLGWYLLGKPFSLWQWGLIQSHDEIHIYPIRKSIFTSAQLAKIINQGSKAAHVALFPLAMIGVILVASGINRSSTQRAPYLAVIVAVILTYWSILHTALLSLPRYGIPMRSLLYLMAIWRLYTLINVIELKFRQLRGRRTP